MGIRYAPRLATCQYDEQAVLQSFRESVTIIVLLLTWLKPWNIASPKRVVNILMETSRELAHKGHALQHRMTVVQQWALLH